MRTLGLARRVLPAAALVLAVTGTAGCAGADQGTGPGGAQAGAGSRGFHGQEPDRPPPRPQFVLTDSTGAPFDFGQQTAGRPTLLYFGYANCPDLCPTAMADIAAALRQTPAALQDQTRVVMVTTDPDRDTGPVLERFLRQFNTTFIGLTGTQEQVDAAQRAVGIDPAPKGGPVPTLPGRPGEHEHAAGTAAHEHYGPLGYGVSHADVIFAYDAADRLPVLYTGSTQPSDIAADLPRLATA